MTARFFIILCILGISAIGNTHAQIYLATAAGGGSSGNSGTSWNSPLDGSVYLTSKANAALAPANTTIYMKEGAYTYSPAVNGLGTSISNGGIKVIGGFPNTATGTDISGYDPVAHPTVIKIDNGGLLFRLGSGSFTLKGVECNASGTATGKHVIAPGSTCDYTITDVYIHDMYNGAAFNFGGSGNITVTNSLFKDNSWSVGAAAIFVNGGFNLTVKDCSFTNNQNTSSNSGGAIGGPAASGSATFTIDHSYFCGNSANAYGAGIHKQAGGTILLKNGNVFYNNTTVALSGDGGTVSYGLPTTVSNDGTTVFSNNYGGGIARAGVASTNTGNNSTATYTCPTSINAVVVNVQGSIWNDADGNLALNGSETGTNAGGPLYVNLVDATGTLVTSVSVAANGSYSLPAPTNTTGLKLILSTSPTATTPGPLPTGWVNTGEIAGTGNTAAQSATLGQIELTTGTTATLTGQSFGIEQRPTTGSGTATVSNAGGTSAVTIPPSAFTSTSPSTDTAPGSVTAIRITSFPTNVTSLTINGTVYTSLPGGGIVVPTNSSGAPTVPILLDPTNDSNPVSFNYVAVDNAGKEATNTGTATINSTLTTSVSGSVWNDADGSVMLNGSETGTNAGATLYVNLVNGSGTVVGSATVASDGSYTLTGVPTNVTGYKLVLSTSLSSATAGPLPTGWVNTGEIAGTGNTATQSATLGQIELSTATGAVTGASFGIEQRPTTGSGSATVSNSGGTNPVTIPPSAFTATSPSTDTAPGSVTAIRITSFPSNVTSLTINGNVYTASSPEFTGGTPTGVVVPTDGNGGPTVPILIDPTNDSNTVSFSFVAVDNAGKEATNTGTTTITSSLLVSVSGHIYDDADGADATNGVVSTTLVNGPSLPVYISLVQAGVVVATVPVLADGSYTLPSVSPGTYSLVLTTNSAGSTTASLPATWANTGENLGTGPGNDGTADGVLVVGAAGNISNANFGIDQIPTALPVSQTYVNPSGTNTVQVPTLSGTDPEDGTLGAGSSFVIHSLPASGTLFFQGTALTAADVAGTGFVITGYDPTTLTYDPVDGPGSYSFACSSVDAAQVSSTTTTATMIFTAAVPDLTPIIYARPSAVHGTKAITVVVDVLELKGVATSGLITVRVSKDPHISLSLTAGASLIGGRSVQNSLWSFDGSSDPVYYVLTSTQPVAASGQLSFGLEGSLNPSATNGNVIISSVVDPNSGGETRVNNNADADRIDYFQL